MKDLYTPYVRPDGIIVGIKGKAPKKRDYLIDDDGVERYQEALTAFIQSGHAFESQDAIMIHLYENHLKAFYYDFETDRHEIKPGLLPPIELDVEEVENTQDPCTQCGSTAREQLRGCNEITCYKGRPGFNRTVLRIAKEEVRGVGVGRMSDMKEIVYTPTKPEEATETQEEQLLNWILDNIDGVDGDWYWKEDTEGDQPMSSKDIIKEFTIQRKPK